MRTRNKSIKHIRLVTNAGNILIKKFEVIRTLLIGIKSTHLNELIIINRKKFKNYMKKSKEKSLN